MIRSSLWRRKMNYPTIQLFTQLKRNEKVDSKVLTLKQQILDGLKLYSRADRKTSHLEWQQFWLVCASLWLREIHLIWAASEANLWRVSWVSWLGCCGGARHHSYRQNLPNASSGSRARGFSRCWCRACVLRRMTSFSLNLHTVPLSCWVAQKSNCHWISLFGSKLPCSPEQHNCNAIWGFISGD